MIPTTLASLALLSATTLLSAGLSAQTPEAPTAQAGADAAKPTAGELVHSALRQWYRAPFTATGTVRIEAEDAEGMGMMVVGGPAATGAPFEGAIEVVRTDRNQVLIASRKANPGLAIFAHGKQVTASVTTPIDKPIDVKALHEDVAAMLDAKAFLGWAGKKASWKLHKDAGATRTYRARQRAPEPEMPAMDDFGGVEGMPAMIDPMAPRILHSIVEVTIDEAGGVAAIALRVTRSDPMAMIAEVAAESGEVDFQDLMEAEPVEGPVHHIELTIQKHAPSPRSKGLIKQLAPKAR